MTSPQKDQSQVISGSLQLVDSNPRFLANPNFLQGVNLVPHALSPTSPHRELYEITADGQRLFVGYMIGVCGGSAQGLCVGAAGSIADGVTIDDTTHVKLHIPITALGGNVAEADNVWIDQSCGLDELMALLAGGEAKLRDFQASSKILMRHMLKIATGSSFSTDTALGRLRNEYVQLVSADLYDVKLPGRNSAALSDTNDALTGTRKRTRIAAGLEDDPQMAGGLSSSSATAVEPLHPETITLASKYDPACLDDHVGDRFRHISAKVNQFDFRDVDNTLIPPWRFNEVFRPGAVMVVGTSFNMWEMPPKGNMIRPSLTFQPQIKTIKILCAADHVPSPSAPLAPAPRTAVPIDVATDFDQFCLKLDHDAGLVNSSQDVLMIDVAGAGDQDASDINDGSSNAAVVPIALPAVDDCAAAPSTTAKGKKRRA